VIFLPQFKRALPSPLRLSAAVGGFWKKSGTAPTKAAVNVDIPTLKGSEVVLFSMDTYDGEDDVFSRNIATGATNVGQTQPENWGVGLAWSKTSWPAPKALARPTTPQRLPPGETRLQLGPGVLQQRRPGDVASRRPPASRALRPPPGNLDGEPASRRLGTSAPRALRSPESGRLHGQGGELPAGIDPVVYAAFQEYDRDGSGSISREEAMEMIKRLQLRVSDGYTERAWDAYDTDASGFLDLWEFAKMMDEGIYRNALQSIHKQHRKEHAPALASKQHRTEHAPARMPAPRRSEQAASRVLSAPVHDRRSTPPRRDLVTNDGDSGDGALAAQRRLNQVLLDRLDLCVLVNSQ
jgi:hypothetical protein